MPGVIHRGVDDHHGEAEINHGRVGHDVVNRYGQASQSQAQSRLVDVDQVAIDGRRKAAAIFGRGSGSR